MTNAWTAALQAAGRARVTVVVGASDTGKTTLVARLASALCAEAPVAVVDADLGQSEIGPPTTVGLGLVRAPVSRLAAAELVAARFVGATTPVRCIRELATATAGLVERARSDGAARVVVDTCGLIAGGFGVAVKRALVEATAADVAIILERAEECTALARALAERRPVVRVRAETGVLKRSAVQRRQWRTAAFARYLAGATDITLDPGRVTLRVGCGRRVEDDARGAVVGLEDAAGAFLGLGAVSEFEGPTRALVVATAVAPARIAAATIGEARVNGDR